MKTPKILFDAKYKPGTSLKAECNPVLNHLNNDFKVEKTFILAAGKCTFDGEEYEFNDLRILIKEKT